MCSKDSPMHGPSAHELRHELTCLVLVKMIAWRSSEALRCMERHFWLCGHEHKEIAPSQVQVPRMYDLSQSNSSAHAYVPDII